MSNIAGGLSGFYTPHEYLRVYASEGVNNNFAFDTLNWVDHNGYCTRIKHFLTLLSLHICT